MDIQGTFIRVAHAAEEWQGLVDGDVATFSSIETIFSNLISAIISLAGIGLFIMLLVGGFGFLFAGGDPKKLEQARGTLSNAIIGLVIIISAYLIIRIISVFTGIDALTTFEIPTQ
jgi:hypothetical protein